MGGERMAAKRSIASLVRKKLSDITNSQTQPQKPPPTSPSHKNCIEQLLKEKDTLLQLLAERDKIIELNGAELMRLRANVQKLQLQNWNLAQSNSQILAELNLGRERIKTLHHEIVCKAALLQGKNSEVGGKEDMKNENNGSVSKVPRLYPSVMCILRALVSGLSRIGFHVTCFDWLQEGMDKAGEPWLKASHDDKIGNRNRRRTKRSRSTGSSSKVKVEVRSQLRRQYEDEAMENSFETEDAETAVSQTGPSSPATEDETGENFGSKPLRKAVEKVQSYKEIPLKAKLRRLE
ncbi:Shugoshin 2 [Senna tora]|uniref:Shugoshin 2 n=1 Tax=Senna tora TaxID=362788 RepID=A0A834SKT0_9FABA|nr:Shugoshin 2 [Senna tora]